MKAQKAEDRSAFGDIAKPHDRGRQCHAASAVCNGRSLSYPVRRTIDYPKIRAPLPTTPIFDLHLARGVKDIGAALGSLKQATGIRAEDEQARQT